MARSVAFLLATLVAFPAAASGRLTLRDLRQAGLLPPAPRVMAVPPAEPVAPVSVGDPRAFWTYDLSVMPPKNLQVPATCRAVGQTVYVYVADSVWDGAVVQSDVDAIVQAFDASTPAEPDEGITAAELALFGTPPDVDSDPHLIIFIYPIAGYGGYTFDGFFRPEDEAPYDAACRSNPSAYCSNVAEMIHVNASSPGSAYMLGVMAHEFQHLIHYGEDPDEQAWINEAMSELAMAVLGYEDAGNLDAYVAHHGAALVSNTLVDYGAVMLWGVYLYEQEGAPFITALVANPKTGIAGVDDELAQGPSGKTFATLFPDWALANALHLAPPGPYSYGLLSIPGNTPDGPLPDLGSGTGALSATIGPTSYRWWAGTLPDLAEGTTVRVALDAGSSAVLRVATVADGEATVADGEDGTYTVTAVAGGPRLVVLAANPGAANASIHVALDVVTPGMAEAGPEAAPDAATDDAAPADAAEGAGTDAADAAAENAADAAIGADTAIGTDDPGALADAAPDAGAPDATTGTDAQGDVRPSKSSGGGCATTPRPAAGATLPFLVLLGVAAVLRRRSRA